MSGTYKQLTLYDFFYPLKKANYQKEIQTELENNVYYNDASEYSLECQKQLLTEIENLYKNSQPLCDDFEGTILTTDDYIKISHYLVKIIELYNKTQVLNTLL